MEENKTCPKCSGNMLRGKLLGAWGGPTWVADKPNKSFLGVRLNAFQERVIGYRCEKCKFIEFYGAPLKLGISQKKETTDNI